MRGTGIRLATVLYSWVNHYGANTVPGPSGESLRRSRDVGTAANIAGGHVIMKNSFMFSAEGHQADSAFNFCSYIDNAYRTDRSPATKEIVK